MSVAILFRNARLLDPALQTDTLGDLLVHDGVIAPDPTERPTDCREIDATGLTVTPGLIDLHVHFREPGGEEAETWASGAACAAAGGFTTVVTMPNTHPPADSVEFLETQAAATAKLQARILPSACLTVRRAGKRVADLEAMAKAGAAAFTDDGSIVDDEKVMAAAMTASAAVGKSVMDHAVITEIAGNGVIRESETSRRLGVPGMPAAAEVEAVRRDIRLAAETGCHMHLQHLSTAGAVELIREARAAGLPVSGETTPHHISLTVDQIPGDDANYKMNPPLGTAADVDALIRGLQDGTITCLATDHAPHPAARKALGLVEGPFGILGLEAAVGVTYARLVASGALTPLQWLQAWTTAPAGIIGLPAPTLAAGHRADLALFDLEQQWTFKAIDLKSKSCNCPFIGRELRGRPLMTVLNGRITYEYRSDAN